MLQAAVLWALSGAGFHEEMEAVKSLKQQSSKVRLQGPQPQSQLLLVRWRRAQSLLNRPIPPFASLPPTKHLRSQKAQNPRSALVPRTQGLA